MLIDWFTIGAQALNFIVLIWLMKRFLYQPILNAIDAREKHIADELARADNISQAASAAKASFDAKNREFEQHRAQLMIDATDAANSERQKLMTEAREHATAVNAKQQEALRNDMQALQNSLSKMAQIKLFDIAENALRDLAAVDIESQIFSVFAVQLRRMDAKQKLALQTALQGREVSRAHGEPAASPSTAIKVISSKPLSSDQKNTITATLEEFLGVARRKNRDSAPNPTQLPKQPPIWLLLHRN